MKFISHRGNINKIVKSEENRPDKILYCISIGYDVEIDVWNIDGNYYLGHDEPQYKVDSSFFLNKNLWCHAKNKEALLDLSIKKINCFWHQNDDYTLTYNGFIWVFPNIPLVKNCIAVMPEKTNYLIENLNECYGICSDVIEKYRKIIK